MAFYMQCIMIIFTHQLPSCPLPTPATPPFFSELCCVCACLCEWHLMSLIRVVYRWMGEVLLSKSLLPPINHCVEISREGQDLGTPSLSTTQCWSAQSCESIHRKCEFKRASTTKITKKITKKKMTKITKVAVSHYFLPFPVAFTFTPPLLPECSLGFGRSDTDVSVYG